MSGSAVMGGWIRALQDVASAAAQEERREIVADALEAHLRRTSAAGTTPDGQAWTPLKSGGRPLVNAADHIEVDTTSTGARAVIDDYIVFHHYGTKKDPKRQVIPEILPRTCAEAFKDGLLNHLKKRVKA